MIFLTIIVFFVVDRILKLKAVNGGLKEIKVFGEYFKLNFIPNYNISFSLPLSGPWLNVLVALIMLGVVGYILKTKSYNRKPEIYLWLALIVGAMSNFADRLCWGFVVDYFDLSFFTVFNLADAMISLGALGLIWINWRAGKSLLKS